MSQSIPAGDERGNAREWNSWGACSSSSVRWPRSFGAVNWPSRHEVMRSTAVVLIVVVILALYLGAVDVALSKVVGVILR